MQPILISTQSAAVYHALIHDAVNAHFLSKALLGIQHDLIGYGRPFLGGPTRKEVVALQRTQRIPQQQLWLFWNPTVTPIVIKLVLLF